MLNTKDIYIFVRQHFQQLFCVFFLFFVFAKQTVKCICIINSFYMRMGSDVWPLDGAYAHGLRRMAIRWRYLFIFSPVLCIHVQKSRERLQYTEMLVASYYFH